MNIKTSCLICLSLLIGGCGSDKVERLEGVWELVGENCSKVGVCKKDTLKRVWTFSRQSEDGSKVIFSIQAVKPYIFKGRELFISTAEIVPIESIILLENHILVKGKKNRYFKLVKQQEK